MVNRKRASPQGTTGSADDFERQLASKVDSLGAAAKRSKQNLREIRNSISTTTTSEGLLAIESNLKGLKTLAREAQQVEKEAASGLATSYLARCGATTQKAIDKVHRLKKKAPKPTPSGGGVESDLDED